MDTRKKCSICGEPLPIQRRGRPRTYCGVACRREAEKRVVRSRYSDELAAMLETWRGMK